MCIFGKFYIISTDSFVEINLYKFISISWLRVNDFPDDKNITVFDPVRCPIKFMNTVCKHFELQKCILGEETWYYLTADDIESIQALLKRWEDGICSNSPVKCLPLSYVSYKYIEETTQRWINRRLFLNKDEFYTYFNMDRNADTIRRKYDAI